MRNTLTFIDFFVVIHLLCEFLELLYVLLPHFLWIKVNWAFYRLFLFMLDSLFFLQSGSCQDLLAVFCEQWRRKLEVVLGVLFSTISQ